MLTRTGAARSALAIEAWEVPASNQGECENDVFNGDSSNDENVSASARTAKLAVGVDTVVVSADLPTVHSLGNLTFAYPSAYCKVSY